MLRYWNIPVAGEGVSSSVQSDLTEPALILPTSSSQLHFIPFSSKEMLDIMKAIYDMMGKCTYPILKEETPRQHVEVFFQASEPPAANTVEQTSQVSHWNPLFSLLQKMDKNKDGVVTIDEFIDCCQNVSWTSLHISLSPFSTDHIFCFVGFAQDENIMRSMHLFENVL